MANNRYQGRNDHLKRLDRKYYQGHAYVHWTMATEDRRIGWLTPNFLYKFRELLTHSMSRYFIACPIFCLMPDHIHMVWIGIFERSDQINAIKHFRKHLSVPLRTLGFSLQNQPYDHILRDEERLESSFIDLSEYIARNPERKKLVPVGWLSELRFHRMFDPRLSGIRSLAGGLLVSILANAFISAKARLTSRTRRSAG